MDKSSTLFSKNKGLQNIESRDSFESGTSQSAVMSSKLKRDFHIFEIVAFY